MAYRNSGKRKGPLWWLACILFLPIALSVWLIKTDRLRMNKGLRAGIILLLWVAVLGLSAGKDSPNSHPTSSSSVSAPVNAVSGQTDGTEETGKVATYQVSDNEAKLVVLPQSETEDSSVTPTTSVKSAATATPEVTAPVATESVYTEPAVETPKPTDPPQIIAQSTAVQEPSDSTDTTYVGNYNTKKFHYSYCGSVNQMNESNKYYCNSRETLISEGYIPCKKCNP